MGTLSPLLNKLVQQLTILPGVGPKSAQRIALHLLQNKVAQTRALADCLIDAVENIKPCDRCRNFCEEALCSICMNPTRE